MENNYWRDRIKAEQKAQIGRDRAFSEEVDKLYTRHINELETQIRSFLQRYADKQGISVEEARKRADQFDVKAFEEKARQYVEEKDFSARASAELALYNLKMRMSRAELLEEQLNLELLALANAEEKKTKDYLSDEYRYALETQSGILKTNVSIDGAKAIINTPFEGAVWSERIWKRQDILRGIVSKAVQDMVIKGQNPIKIIGQLRKEFGVSASEAKRLAVTEGARVATEVQKQSMLSNGYDLYEYIAEPSACKICIALDGEIFKTEEMTPGRNAAPMHPHCKCSTAAHYERGSKRDKPDDIKVFEADSLNEIDDFFKEQKSYQRWYNGLSDVSKTSILNYTMSDHTTINGLLRKGRTVYEQEFLSDVEPSEIPYVKQLVQERFETIKGLEKAIQGYTTEKSFKVYRGTRANQGFFEKLAVGEVHSLDKGFLSTSLDRSQALNFANDGSGERFLFDIIVKKGSNSGVYISELSDIPEEKEFLIKPDAKFKVISIKRNSSGLNLISLELKDD